MRQVNPAAGFYASRGLNALRAESPFSYGQDRDLGRRYSLKLLPHRSRVRNFTYKASLIREAEDQLLQGTGHLKGLLDHISTEEQTEIKINSLSEEAFKTSEIEGERLDRESLQSSIRRNFGLAVNPNKFKRAEQGIADMMTGLYDTFDQPLTHETLFDWHKKLMGENRFINDVGQYRTHADAMQIVSGALHKPKVHYEAPPSEQVPMEMEKFIAWFNDTSPKGKKPISAIARAGIAHFYFVCIHPFEDGNGRIGRALILKAICQTLRQPLLLALSYIIQKDKKAYYEALQKNNQTIELTSWQTYFSRVILEAVDYSRKLASFVVKKAKFYQKVENLLNERQKTAIDRMLREGPDSFPYGLNAEKYIRITGTSRATATRDLNDLVEKKIFNKTGERKSTRYKLTFFRRERWCKSGYRN